MQHIFLHKENRQHDAEIGFKITKTEAKKFQAQAIEMEGAAIAQVVEQFGVRCMIVRSLSDLSGEESMEDFPTFLKEAAARSYRVVNAILGVL